jgi:hypothetical protein
MAPRGNSPMLQDQVLSETAHRPVLPGAAPAYQRAAGKSVARTAKASRRIKWAGTILAVEPSMTNADLARKLGRSRSLKGLRADLRPKSPSPQWASNSHHLCGHRPS